MKNYYMVELNGNNYVLKIDDFGDNHPKCVHKDDMVLINDFYFKVKDISFSEDAKDQYILMEV